MDKETWLWMKLYTPTQVLMGYAYYPYQQRLLDLLNSAWPGALEHLAEFLPLSEVAIQYPDGREERAPTAFVNKASVQLVRALEENRSNELGTEAGHRPYPFIEKLPVVVKLHLPAYYLTGRIHCARGERVWDVLNHGPRFLPLTDVDMMPEWGSPENGLSFMAVNKGHIINAEETGTPLMEVFPTDLPTT